MNTEVATGPAWQVRESERQTFLEDVLRRARGLEDTAGRINLYRVLFSLLDQRLARQQAMVRSTILPEIPWDAKEAVCNFFDELLGELRSFQRTEEEGMMLFGKLLERAAKEIAEPSGIELRNQEFLEPERIWGVGVKNGTDQVPLE
jgi:hypothetical protein